MLSMSTGTELVSVVIFYKTLYVQYYWINIAHFSSIFLCIIT